MPNIIFTLSAGAVGEVNDALAYHFGYQPNITAQTGTDAEGNPVYGQVPNPETKAAFAKRMVIQHFLKDKVLSYRRAMKLAEVSNVEPDIT